MLERGITFALGIAAWLLVAVAITLDPAPEGLGTHKQLGMAPCTFHQMTGQPCPGCGMTTAFADMAHGRVLDALIAQPFGAVLFVIVLTLAVVLTMSALAGRSLKPALYSQRAPTVIYGLGETFDGNLTRRHLQTDTPYNTCVRNGLPPTPIALPGESALQATCKARVPLW